MPEFEDTPVEKPPSETIRMAVALVALSGKTQKEMSLCERKIRLLEGLKDYVDFVPPKLIDKIIRCINNHEPEQP